MELRIRSGSTPAIVLIHGAFSDASIWSRLIADLQSSGIGDVIAPAVPLRGLASDASYVASVAARFDGPVLLVGHSYGGAVATVAAANTAADVVGLVYVTGFALDVGESTSTIGAGFAKTPFAAAVIPSVFRTGDGSVAVELVLRLDAFSSVFASDLPKQRAAVMAVSQRPIATTALDEQAQAAGWKLLPSWYVLATADRMIDPSLQRFMALRAGAKIVEVDASHALPLSQPTVVCAVILSALE